MSPGSSTESYPAFARIGLRENLGKNLNQEWADAGLKVYDVTLRSESALNMTERIKTKSSTPSCSEMNGKKWGRKRVSLKPSLIQTSTRTRLYQIIARPVLCYGSEAWAIRTKDESRLTACEMRFMRRTAGYTKWDRKKNEDILQELNVSSILDYISRYQLNCKERVSRMVSSRIPKAIMKYRRNGKRSLGRPMKRWQENRFSRP
ncbi:hypothetical protein ANN_17197 [Periplaneta americana]|uniref:Endonuclease-reverse transcriptase n=1 Tax=Periplaneta americana TaxID=6978 RepID=A0ABQ8STP1_PERAM|nr:hypothetical protein ANN_17197 [Periplaneta americana]